MDALTVIFWSLVVPCSMVIFTFWLLTRHGKKRPQEHTATRTKKDTIDRELEEDSREDSQLEIGSGSEFFPEEFPEDENDS